MLKFVIMVVMLICMFIGFPALVKYYRLKDTDAEKAYKYYMRAVFFIGALLPLGLMWSM